MKIFILKNAFLITLMFFFFLYFPAYAENRYNLEQLFDIAVQKAEIIAISREENLISGYQKDKAFSTLIPDVYAMAGHRRYSGKKSASMTFGPIPSFGSVSFDRMVQPENASNWGAGLKQELSLGGREFIAVSISKDAMKKSKYEINRVSEEYLMNVATTYFNVLKAIEAAHVAGSNRERLKVHRDSSEKRFIVGKDTKTILLRAEAELSGAEAQLVSTENGLELSKIILARLVGLETDFELEESSLKEPDNIEIELLLEKAYNNRSEMMQANLDKKISGKQVKYARGSYYPGLSINGVYSKTDTDPGGLNDVDEEIYIEAALTLPIFEGGFRKADVREAKARRRQSTLLYLDTKKNVSVEVKQAILNLTSEKKTLKSYEDQLVSSKENFKVISRQFDVGLASSVDFIDANTLLLMAETQLSKAYYNYQHAIIQLKKATGQLIKK